MGVNHSTKGTETVNAINNLALLTGNIGRPGASPFSITGQCNAMGTREAGFRRACPGIANLNRTKTANELARLWNVSVDRIPTRARSRVSRHHRGCSRRKDSRTLDHRHQSPGFVPEYRRSQTGTRQPGFSGGAGWLPSHSDDGVGRPGFAGRDLGREGGNLHQLRTPREQGESQLLLRQAKRAATSRSFSRSPNVSGCREELFPAGKPGRRVRRVAPRVCGAAVRLLRHDLCRN